MQHEATPNTPDFAKTSNNQHLHALTGIRFFAVLHIFLFHLWSLYTLDTEPPFERLMSGMASMPEGVITFFSNGWMSTSFFFILSGFILSYLYWGEDGRLTTTTSRFLLLRLSRIYPIHLLTLAIAFLMMGSWYLTNKSLGEILPSAVATLLLVQSWFPPWVPMWSWPTWTISTLVFLYLLMPWLMTSLSRLSGKTQRRLLFALPFISIVPTAVYAFFFPSGSEPVQNWQIFIGSFPPFWIAQFVAGMLLSRVLRINRFNSQWRPEHPSWFAWGDLALLSAVVLACLPDIEEPLKYFLRHGLMAPLFMLAIVDMAKGKGLAARLFSTPGTGMLGNTAFSIFIWQNLIMIFCWVTVSSNPEIGEHQLWAATLSVVVVSLVSTYAIEKPIARAIRRRIDKRDTAQGDAHT